MDYKRYFVTLRCDGKGYEYKNRRPLGQCIIEQRGTAIKISIMVQDLKPETVYSPYIICSREGRNVGLPIGKLNVNTRGKGELRRELEDIVGRKDPSLLGFCAVVILVHKKDDFVSPLVGYKEEEVMWKSNLQFLGDMSKQDEEKKASPEMSEPTETDKPVLQREEESEKEAPAREEAVKGKHDGKTSEIETTVESKCKKEILMAEEQKEEILAEEMPMEEILMAEEQKEEILAEEVSMKEILMAEEQNEEILAEQTPIEELSMGEDLKEQSVASESLVEETSVVGTLNEENSEKETPITESQPKENAVEEISETKKRVNEFPKEEVSIGKTSAEECPNEETGSRVNGKNVYSHIDKETSDLHESFKTMAQKFRKEMEELENFQFYPNEGEGEDEKEKKPQADVHVPSDDPEVKDDLDYIFKHNIGLTPFKRQNRMVTWVRISLREPISLPINYQLLMKSTFVILAYKKYNHLILGVTTDSPHRQYILGIPGVFESEHKGTAFKLGFTQFKCCDDINPRYGEHGYWLMFIDA